MKCSSQEGSVAYNTVPVVCKHATEWICPCPHSALVNWRIWEREHPKAERESKVIVWVWKTSDMLLTIRSLPKCQSFQAQQNSEKAFFNPELTAIVTSTAMRSKLLFSKGRVCIVLVQHSLSALTWPGLSFLRSKRSVPSVVIWLWKALFWLDRWEKFKSAG